MILNTRRYLSHCLVLTVFLGACTSYQSIGPPDTAWYQLKPGDQVDVVMKDATHYRFAVTAVDSTAISGDQVQVPWSGIASVEKKVSAGKTALYALGFINVIGLILALFGVVLFI